jgi:hypothetical protein
MIQRPASRFLSPSLPPLLHSFLLEHLRHCGLARDAALLRVSVHAVTRFSTARRPTVGCAPPLACHRTSRVPAGDRRWVVGAG